MAQTVLAAESLRRLFQVLYPETLEPEEQSHLYAVLDAARNPWIYRALHEHEGTVAIRCLYQGEMAERLSEVAPYLVQLERTAPFTRWLLEGGWGQSWGIFIRSAARFDEVRRQLRKLTVVGTEDGKSLLFRFYDPRVLRVFLPMALPDQLRQMFGDVVERYIVEEESGNATLEFTRKGGQLQMVKRAL
jgi:hypothetical protein